MAYKPDVLWGSLVSPEVREALNKMTLVRQQSMVNRATETVVDGEVLAEAERLSEGVSRMGLTTALEVLAALGLYLEQAGCGEEKATGE